MAYDFKKEEKALYHPKTEPSLVTVPPMLFLAVEGRGDPNEPGGAYFAAVQTLYALSYTIKMSKMGAREIPGFFDYTVAPLEGLWWMEDGRPGVDYQNKAGFCWISMIRQPDFVTEEVLDWAKAEAKRKKGVDCAAARLMTYDEGLCVQCLHIGAYDDEPATGAKMDAFLAQNGCGNDIGEVRKHHEIYFSNPRTAETDKWKTILRHPIKKI